MAVRIEWLHWNSYNFRLRIDSEGRERSVPLAAVLLVPSTRHGTNSGEEGGVKKHSAEWKEIPPPHIHGCFAAHKMHSCRWPHKTVLRPESGHLILVFASCQLSRMGLSRVPQPHHACQCLSPPAIRGCLGQTQPHAHYLHVCISLSPRSVRWSMLEGAEAGHWSDFTPEGRGLWAVGNALGLHGQFLNQLQGCTTNVTQKNAIYLYFHALHLLSRRRDQGQELTPVEYVISFLCQAVGVGSL